jgi:hypothetical protein
MRGTLLIGAMAVLLGACEAATYVPAPPVWAGSSGTLPDGGTPDGGLLPDGGLPDGGAPDSGPQVSLCGTPPYPCGPYGFDAGDTIADLSFTGATDSNGDGVISSTDSITTLAFDQYFARPGAKVLVVLGEAMWLSSSASEQARLATMYTGYADAGAGVEFFEALLENNAKQSPSTNNMNQWANAHPIPFDLGIDPNKTLLSYVPPLQLIPFPIHMVVRTRDMVIVYAATSTDLTALQQQIDAVLDGGT